MSFLSPLPLVLILLGATCAYIFNIFFPTPPKYSISDPFPTTFTKNHDIPFGHLTKEVLFLQPEGLIQLNHGSFGSVPLYVQQYRKALLSEQQSNPEEWFRVTLRKKLRQVKERMGQYLNCDAADLALVENASTGTNTVLRSLPLSEKDTIVYFNIEYSTTKTVIEYTCEQKKCRTHVISLPFPVKDKEQILEAFEHALDTVSHVTLAVFDHISSVPAIRLPIKEMISMCREKGIETLIDGAHAIGQVPVDLSELKPHYWVSNGHKWLFSPPGSAVLYVDKAVQHKIHPLIISYQYQKGFRDEFEWIGTRDWTPELSMGAALDFRAALGEDAIQEHNTNLCRTVAQYVTERWNTSLGVPLSMSDAMVNIRIPCSGSLRENDDVAQAHEECTHSWNISDAITELKDLSKVWVVLYESEKKVRFVRLSCQIYNELEDYEYFVREFETNLLKRQ